MKHAYQKNIPLKESLTKSICHHDKAIDAIYDHDTLIKEFKYQIENDFLGIKMVLDEKVAEKEKITLQKNYPLNLSQMAHYFYQQKIDAGKTLLATRRANHLTDYPTHEELDEILHKRLKEFYNQGFFVENAIIYKKTFLMERMQDNIEDYYWYQFC